MKLKVQQLSGRPVHVYLYHLLPWMLGLLCLSSVPIVDGYFLGNYAGGDALAVVNLSMPVIGLILALEIIISNGASIRCGHYLGQGLLDDASRLFTQSIIAVFVIKAVTALVALVLLEPLISLLGSPAALSPQLYDYLATLLWFNVFLPSALMLNFFVGMDHNPLLASLAMIASALINIALTWLFVGQWQLGVIGAAYGSGISGLAAFIILSAHFFKKERQLRWVFTWHKWTEVFTTLKNGLSDGIADAGSALVILLMNWLVVSEFGVTGLVALAVVSFTTELHINLVFGFGDTLQILVSTNHGANKPKRIARFLQLAQHSGMWTGFGFIALVVFASEPLTRFFIGTTDAAALALIDQIFEIIAPVFLLSSVNVILMTYFTALEKAHYAMGIALARTLIFPALMLLILPLLMGRMGIFAAIPVAELLSLGLSLMFYRDDTPTLLGDEADG